MGSEIYLAAGDQFGDGWWGDRWKDVKKAAKAVQSNQTVRDLEKSAVKVGAKALRGAVETGLDGVADSALTALGAPELAPLADKFIDKGVKELEKKGTSYLDQQIDKSGQGYGGVRYMSAGGGMRLAGSGTQVGAGMRLAGSGMRLAGGAYGQFSWHDMARGVNKLAHAGPVSMAGNGMRLAGSGTYVRPLVEGSGCACH